MHGTEQRFEPRQARELSLELERALLRELRRTYEDLNAKFFERRLQRPVLDLSDASGRLGRWLSHSRTLELDRALLFEHDWGTLVEVLKHEMAHQYVHDVLGLRDEAAHGPKFREVCQARGIDARAAGLPAGSSNTGGAAGEQHEKLLERVAKLLALAESPNEHEAQVAMSTAQRLMLKYNIDAALRGDGGAGRYAFRHLGQPSGRIGESQRILAVILSEHFFVEVIWVSVWRPRQGKRGRLIEACGTPENLELAAYVHDFLSHTAERLWREHKRRLGIRRDRDRRSYVAGVMAGFRDKLEAERRHSGKVGLVWVGDPGLESYFKRRHPRMRWDRRSVWLGSEAYSRGRDAGRRIVLHRGIEARPSGSVRLLPGGRG